MRFTKIASCIEGFELGLEAAMWFRYGRLALVKTFTGWIVAWFAGSKTQVAEALNEFYEGTSK